MKKFVSLFLVLCLGVSMAACGQAEKSIEDTALTHVPEQLTLVSRFTKEELAEEIDFNKAEKENDVATADDGEVTISNKSIPASTLSTSNSGGTRTTTPPEQRWDVTSENAYSNDVFTLPDAVIMSDGSLGRIQIPKIGLDVGIFETDNEIESMTGGVAHMKETSCWSGNVGLAAHNSGASLGYKLYFKDVHTLQPGDQITYTTALGTRTYSVTGSSIVAENDWSLLGRTDTNQLTLVTCVTGQWTDRLIIQAVES